MRFWIFIPVSVGLAAACGPHGVTSLSETKQLSTLNDAERTTLCRDLIDYQSQHYTADAAKRVSCSLNAQITYTGSHDAAACRRDFDACMAKPADVRMSETQMPKDACKPTSFTFKPTCTNTVGDMARCYEALGRSIDQRAAAAPNCTDSFAMPDTSACDFMLSCVKTGD